MSNELLKKSSIETTANGNSVTVCMADSVEQELDALFQEIESERSAEDLQTYLGNLL